MNRALYPREWDTISKQVRERAGQRCETCRVANYAVIYRAVDGKSWYDPAEDEIRHYPSGERWDRWKDGEDPEFREKETRVVLTTSHTNHDTRDNRPDNLASLCQLCHNRHDAEYRKGNRARTRLARKAAGSLFAEVEP